MASKKKWIKAQWFQSSVHKSILAKVKLLPKAKSLRKLRKQGQKKKQKNLSHNSYSRLREKRPKNEKKVFSWHLSICTSWHWTTIGLVRMFFDMSLTNSRKGCMTMVKVKYDKKVDCMQNYAKQSVKKSIKESSNVQRRVFF